MKVNIFSVRDSIDSFEIIKNLEKSGVKANSLSIVKTNYKNIPNFRLKYDFIVLTSSKSVKSFLQYIKLYKRHFLKIPKVFIVGPETGKKLKINNFFKFHQALGNTKSLIKVILSNTKIYNKGLWLCGKNRNNQFKDNLLKRKRFLKTTVVYDMFQKDIISEHLIKKLKKQEKKYFLVNSSRNVSILTMLLKKYNLFDNLKKNTILVTMSKKIYDRAVIDGWENIQVIAEVSRELFLCKFINSLNFKEKNNG